MQPNRGSRFAFVDEGEAVRRLGVSRDTLLSLIEGGRLRTYAGVGKGNFFRVTDLEALAAELHPTPPVARAPAGVPISLGGLSAAGRREHDPAMKVHLRLQADLKWLDLSEDDLRAWVREVHPAAYEKSRGNISRVVDRLSRLRDLLDEAAARWQHPPRISAAPPAEPPAKG